MNFSLYIAKRYLISKSDQNAINIINFITFLVIVIGSAALFIVLSAFAGLKAFSLSFTTSFDPDLKAVSAYGKVFSLTQEDVDQLNLISEVEAYAKEIEERVYLTFEEKNHLAHIKGVDENYRQVIDVDSALYFGNWGVADNNTVMGIGLYHLLGVPLNNYNKPMNVLALKPGKGPLSPQSISDKPYNQLPMVVSGVFNVEESLDKKFLFAQLPLVQALLEKESSEFSGINFKLKPNTDIEVARQRIKKVLGPKTLLLSRQEQNSTLYRMLNTEYVATYLIFTLVLVIALFNVVGAIIMMILDKRQNLKTLYSLGVTLRELRRIYFVQGVLLTALGGLIGVLIGVVVIGSQLLFGWLRITPSLAYPVQFEFVNIWLVLATILVLGLFSAKIASSRISQKFISA